VGNRKRKGSRFQIAALDIRLAPGGRGGLGGEVYKAHVAHRQARVAPPWGGEVARPESAPVACAPNIIWFGQETNAGNASLYQKVREA
jgi:hypothetical protein